MTSDRTYPGIVAALPTLRRGGSEDFRFVNLANLYRDLLDPADRTTLSLVYLPIDHDNLIHRLFEKRQFQNGGNFSEDRIIRCAQGQDIPFPFWDQFLDVFQRERLGLPTAQRLLTTLYWRHLLTDHPLLAEWARIRLYLRRMDFAAALEDQPGDPLHIRAEVEALETIPAELLTFPGKGRDGLPNELLAAWREPDLMQREVRIDQWFWDFLDRETVFQPFHLPGLIAYSLRQTISARWSTFTKLTPTHRLDQILEAVNP